MDETRSDAAPPEAPPAPDAAPDEAAVAPPDPLEEARAEAARLKDQLLRTAADFDNFRKRSRREVGDAERKGRDDVLKDLLPVFDNLERAMAHADKATDGGSVAEGLLMVLRQFTDTLAKLGIERIQALGLPFDPAQHEAVQQVETDDHPPGTVAFEVQAGYRAGDKLLRPAIVVVARAKTAPAPAEPAGGTDGDGPGPGSDAG